MRTFVSIAAVFVVVAGAALAAGPSRVPAYDYGLTGNDWWAGHYHAAHRP